MTVPRSLHKTLGFLEYFTFGFGSMVGVGWVVLMDDWLGRGGPGGAMLGFLLGGLLLLPIARTYARLVRDVPDAGAEIAYTERCPWEAAAIGNLLARVFPAMNALPLYEVAGKVITAPRLVAGLLLTALVTVVNYRGIRVSGRFQDVTTLGLLACFAVFGTLGFARGSAARLAPPFAAAGPFISVLLVMQIVPYFMTGFESVAKASEEARPGFDPRDFGRAITLAVVAGSAFYALVVGAVAFVYPWRELVSNHLGTEAAFARAFGSAAIARLILAAAFLSLFKVMNGNFMAATRLLLALGRRGLVHPSLGAVHPRYGTPRVAIVLLALLTAATAFLGDALLVPVTEVGALAAGVGWCAACLTPLLARPVLTPRSEVLAIAAVIVSFGIVLMKVIPGVPGSFTLPEWIALAAWCALGAAFWVRR